MTDYRETQNIHQLVTVFSMSIRQLAESIGDLAEAITEHNDVTKEMLDNTKGPVKGEFGINIPGPDDPTPVRHSND